MSKALIEVTNNCINEDWKTALARKQERLVAGDIVEYKGLCRNYYGLWIEVYHPTKGFYYLNKNNLKLSPEIEAEYKKESNRFWGKL